MNVEAEFSVLTDPAFPVTWPMSSTMWRLSAAKVPHSSPYAVAWKAKPSKSKQGFLSAFHERITNRDRPKINSGQIQTMKEQRNRTSLGNSKCTEKIPTNLEGPIAYHTFTQTCCWGIAEKKIACVHRCGKIFQWDITIYYLEGGLLTISKSRCPPLTRLHVPYHRCLCGGSQLDPNDNSGHLLDTSLLQFSFYATIRKRELNM